MVYNVAALQASPSSKKQHFVGICSKEEEWRQYDEEAGSCNNSHAIIRDIVRPYLTNVPAVTPLMCL